MNIGQAWLSFPEVWIPRLVFPFPSVSQGETPSHTLMATRPTLIGALRFESFRWETIARHPETYDVSDVNLEGVNLDQVLFGDKRLLSRFTPRGIHATSLPADIFREEPRSLLSLYSAPRGSHITVTVRNRARDSRRFSVVLYEPIRWAQAQAAQN